MYYLNCVDCVITYEIPDCLTDYGNWQRLSNDELEALFVIAGILSPNTMEEIGVFHRDSEGKIAERGNKFFELTDRRFAAVADSDVVIAGQRVQIVKFMVYSREWLTTYFTEPMLQLRDRIQRNRNPPPPPRRQYSSPSPSYATPGQSPGYTPRSTTDSQTDDPGCLNWFRPLRTGRTSTRSRTRLLWYMTVCLTVLNLGLLIGYCACFSYSWIGAHPAPLNYLIAIAVFSLLHTPWQFIRINHSGHGSQCVTSCAMGLVLLLSFVGVFTIPGSEGDYRGSFYDVWTTSEGTTTRNKIEMNLDCCGWTDSSAYGCSWSSSVKRRCQFPVMEQVDSFRGGLRFGAITLFVTQFLFSVLICCSRRDTINLESESP
jgi:hypothetical protein